MGLMRKAAAALGFRDGGKTRKSLENTSAPAAEPPPPKGPLSAPQYEFNFPADLRLSLLSNDSTAPPALPPAEALWVARGSADGRLGMLLASSLRGMGIGALGSPGGSSAGTPTGPSCTGGGHGEAPPSPSPSAGGHNPRRCPSGLRQSGFNVHNLLGPVCNATATPLARRVATRALRKAGDSAPISLPSITSLTGGTITCSNKMTLRDAAPPAIQLPGGAAADAGGDIGPSSPPSSTTASPRPPPLSPHTGHGPSPRMRRSTTLESHAAESADAACQYVAVSVAAAAAVAAVGGMATSPSAISAPCAEMPAGAGGAASLQQPYVHERFSRLASLHPHDAPSYGIPEQASDGGDAGDASIGEAATAAAEASDASLSSLQGAKSVPLYTVQFEDSPPPPPPPSSSAAAVSTAALSAVPTSSNAMAFRSVMFGGGGAAVPRALEPRHSSTSQLSFRAQSQGLTPYNHAQQLVQSRLPPRRVSEYCVSAPPASPNSTLPKLRSIATTVAPVSAGVATTSLKAPEAPTSAAGAAPPPPLTAVAVTAAAESTAAAAKPRAMRCINVEPLPQPLGGGGASGDGAASSSGTSSRSSSAKASSVGGPSASAAAADAAAAASNTKCSVDPSQQQQQQPIKSPQTPRSVRLLIPQASSSPASPFSPVPSAAYSSPSPSPSQSPSQSPCKAPDPELPSRPALSTAFAAPAPPAPKSVPPPRQQQQEQQHLRSTLDDFAPRPSPVQGLLHFSRGAPAQMLRAPVSWGVSDYKVVRKLYAGYASSVYKACCLYSGADVVLKAYNLAGLSTFLRNQVLRELDIHSRLRHPGVVHLMAAFREDDLLVLVLEYVRGGSLDRVRRKLGGRMTEFQAMHLVLLPLLGVLSYLHERGIVHRDIKPENLLFTESWQLKLCDYGVSICTREERAVTRTGSREYMAPEVNVCPLKRLPEDNKDNLQLSYGTAVDVWSLGSLMYELLVGFTPFPGGPPARKEGASGSAGAALAFPNSVSLGARVFVRSCLELEPADRPTVQQLLQHAWIKEALEYNAGLQSPEDVL
ncbi:hypothetical protein PLESTF_000709700 [Pleodorina starrii]|nr:hypothetical protein PLESTM_001798900 [Pleodorina starrii]GLC68569.1 hypothetical protein PLESTF_000709700 [Pleodorina starrii]